MKGKALAIVGILSALIIVFAWFLFLYKPVSDELGQVNSDIEEAKADQISLQGELANLEHLKETEPEIDAKLASLEQAAPSIADEQGLIAAIQAIATANKVELPSVTVAEPTPGTDLSTMSFQLEANGTYRDVTNFLAALLDPAAMARVITFDQMQVTPSTKSGDEAVQGPNTVSVSLSGRAFTTQDAGLVPAEGEAAPAAEDADAAEAAEGE